MTSSSKGKTESPSAFGSGQPTSGDAGEIAAPISLPKGGGAIHGLGEKFDVKLATGTGFLSIPIPTPPCRDFSPQLNLNYNSANGNGILGLGWELNQDFITRKTDKGIPRYLDDDIVLFMGEDLVPLNLDEEGQILPDERRGEFLVRRYARSVEESFHRIERWTHIADLKQVFWKTTSQDNITSIYGRDESSRIQDPTSAYRISRWFLSEMYDCKGNTRVYEYKPEDSVGLKPSGNEKGRPHQTNLYLKRIKYGNREPKRSLETRAPVNLPERWLFSVVLDYGEHRSDVPTTREELMWSCRLDPFSKFRSGFEVRTHRLCQRILMFHHFPEQTPYLQDYLVSSTNFTYDPNPFASFLTSITHVGYLWKENKYSQKSFPPVNFCYSSFPSDSHLDEIRATEFIPTAMRNLPLGLYGHEYQFLDIYGEGLPGIFVEQGSEWFYLRNNGPSDSGEPQFGNLQILPTRPSTPLGSGQVRFKDLAGDGHLDLVVGLDGFFETTDVGWSGFRSFRSRPNIDIQGPNVKLLDLTGDGLADILVSEDQVFTWYRSLGEDGYAEGGSHTWPVMEDQSPRMVFSDVEQAIYLADMSGDGLSDILRVRNGNVCYWPNLGYAKFGPKIIMNNSPLFDSLEQFNQKGVLVADLDGSGTADILYASPKGTTMYLNESGNGFSEGRLLRFPGSDRLSSVKAVDLFGNGTMCLVWSTSSPSATTAFKFWDPLHGLKPHLLTKIINNLGAETHISYSPSTKFYLQDQFAGKPWVTRLPLVVHCIERVEIYDCISKNCYSRRYAYHHGYYDGVEREYRGFAMVEEWDTDTEQQKKDATNINPAINVPPIYTKTWYHTGACGDTQKISIHLANEYYRAPGLQLHLEDTLLPSKLTAVERRKACRSLKGRLLRQEVYAQDGTDRETQPYTIDEYNYTVKQGEGRAKTTLKSVFSVHPREAIHYDIERGLTEPRVQHEMVLEVDRYGNSLQSVCIWYGSSKSGSKLKAQTETVAKYTSNKFANSIDDVDSYRHSMHSETKTYQLYGINEPVTFEDFAIRLNPERMLAYNSEGSCYQKRLLSAARSLYRADNLLDVLPLHMVGSLGVKLETYELVLTHDLVRAVFQCDGTTLFSDIEGTLGEGGYVQFPDNPDWWWTPSGRTLFTSDDTHEELREARSHFFMPRRTRDPFHRDTTTTTYDPYDLLVETVKDACDSIFRVTNDYRTLAPSLTTDPNGNRIEYLTDELGMVIATAKMGKESETLGDSFDIFPDSEELESLDDFPLDPALLAAKYMGSVTQRILYDLDNYRRNNQPVFSVTISRGTHVSELEDPNTHSISLIFCDGFGREIQRKTNASKSVDNKLTWLATGWTVFNNKGKPIRVYEPYFTNTHHFEFENQAGVSSLFIYDPRNRVIATLNPDHTWSKTIFKSWTREEWDANDTVRINPSVDPDVGAYFKALEECEYLPTWWEQRIDNARGEHEKAAATKAEKHANTSTTVFLDTLNRAISVEEDSGEGKLSTEYVLDIQGNVKELIDPRRRIVERNEYDMKGRQIHKASMDSGERWTLYDALGNQILGLDSRKQRFRYVYDTMGRSVEQFLSCGLQKELLVEKIEYGKVVETNTLGRVSRIFDQGGTVSLEYDFKGNLITAQRQFASEYKGVTECARSLQTGRTFVTKSRYDALNREIERTLPDGTRIHYEFNEVGSILAIKAQIGMGSSLPFTTFINKVEYNARGQRVLVNHGNDVTTQYSYDPTTLRLRNLRSTRGHDSSCLQNLSYFYDPVGNITEILDHAQQANFFSEPDNAADPTMLYTYDALYRLIEASGRDNLEAEHDAHRSPHPGQGDTISRYTQLYHYDDAGNMLSLEHQKSDRSIFTREFLYTEESLLQPGKKNNRLSQITVAGKTDTFSYEGLSGLHGNMTRMQGLSLMTWDHKDQLQSSKSDDGRETTFYIYDSRGIRLRKVTERDGRIAKDYIYLDQWERCYASDGLGVETETIHITDLKQRIAVVDITTSNENDSSESNQLIRYQLTNHLKSVNLELDDLGEILTYEEYTPYGNTSYFSSRPLATPKRFRFTSQERDQETSLYYHSARYYSPTICRWINCDPIGTKDGPNTYLYVRCNPVNLRDPTGTFAFAELAHHMGSGAILGAIGGAAGSLLSPMWKAAQDKFGSLGPAEQQNIRTNFKMAVSLSAVVVLANGICWAEGNCSTPQAIERTVIYDGAILLVTAIGSLGWNTLEVLKNGTKEAWREKGNILINVAVGAVGGIVRGGVEPVLEALPHALDHIDVVLRDSLIAGVGYLAKARLKNEVRSMESALTDIGTGAGLSILTEISESTGVTSDVLQAIRNAIV